MRPLRKQWWRWVSSQISCRHRALVPILHPPLLHSLNQDPWQGVFLAWCNCCISTARCEQQWSRWCLFQIPLEEGPQCKDIFRSQVQISLLRTNTHKRVFSRRDSCLILKKGQKFYLHHALRASCLLHCRMVATKRDRSKGKCARQGSRKWHKIKIFLDHRSYPWGCRMRSWWRLNIPGLPPQIMPM